MATLKDTTIYGNLKIKNSLISTLDEEKITFEDSSWNDIIQCVQAGKGEELFPVGSIKRGMIRGTPCSFIVIDHDYDGENTMTILLLEDNPTYGSWSNVFNGINRSYGNSQNNGRVYADSILTFLDESPYNINTPTSDQLKIVTKTFWTGNVDINNNYTAINDIASIQCKLFIPSIGEIGENHLSQMEYDFSNRENNTSYKYFMLSRGLGFPYWTRSPYYGEGSSSISYNGRDYMCACKFQYGSSGWVEASATSLAYVLCFVVG